jgi:hypothetical protein
MTPPEVETRPQVEPREERLTTADLANPVHPDHELNPVRSVTGEDRADPLFSPNDAQSFRTRWEKIQIGFVDEPRKAVEQADELVAGTIKRLAEVFATERQKLEANWDKHDNVSTEDLRVALRRYRSFFDRLLSV